MAIDDGTGADHRDEEDPIDEAAAAWVVRLASSDATAADHAAFDAWLAADPVHAAAYAEMDAVWRQLGRLPDRAPIRGSRKGPACLAAILVLGGALAIQAGLADWLRSDLWSGTGDIAHATLPDGSRVDLNTATALALHFSGTERRVSLLRGEAVFDVARDPARPFVVEGGGISVRAVGTVFYVRVDAAAQPVGVAEGRVDVAVAGRHVAVSAGEAFREGPAGGVAKADVTKADVTKADVTKADVARAMAWRDGRLTVSGERLSDVLAELGRYRRGRIVLLDRQAGERRVTGAFDLRDSDDALDALAAGLSLRVTRLTPLLVLVGSPV